MEQHPLSVTAIVPFTIVATIFPALERWIIFGASSSVLASLEYWFVYGLTVSASSFVLWYWLIVSQERRKAGRF